MQASSPIKSTSTFSRPFWVVWAIELWERFGYYGVQAILAMYFVKQLGYSESKSFYVFGSFTALAYGFVWVGGWIGDNYLGTKRTMVLGAIVLMFSYIGLATSNHHTIFYALAGIVVGNSLFKANPSSLISKLYAKGDARLDSAMTLYYMAVNVGSMLSMSLTPIIARDYGAPYAFWVSAFGLGLGLANYIVYRHILSDISTGADKQPFCITKFAITLTGSLISLVIFAQLLNHTTICNILVYIVVTGAFAYFLKLTFSTTGITRTRMLVAFLLILEGVLFFVLYNQMPTSLTFFALHNIDNHVMHMTIPAAEYQVLNPIIIVIMSPILAWIYKRFPATHVTKFSIGMTFCAAAFLVLAIPQYTTTTGLASPAWMVLTYFLQSTGELLISALGLAMVAELCPRHMSGFVMGLWWITCMLAGPIGAWVGSLTAMPASAHFSTITSMHIYAGVFEKLGLATAFVALLMWLSRPALNRLLSTQ